jgi:hypothetical protein
MPRAPARPLDPSLPQLQRTGTTTTTTGPPHPQKLRASWTTILKQPDDVIGLDAPGRAGMATVLKDFRNDLKQYGCL